MEKQHACISNMETLQSVIQSMDINSDTLLLDINGKEVYIDCFGLQNGHIPVYDVRYSNDGKLEIKHNYELKEIIDMLDLQTLLKRPKHALGDSNRTIAEEKHALGDYKVSMLLDRHVKGFKVTPNEVSHDTTLRALRVGGQSMLRVTSSGAISSRYQKLRFCTECMKNVQLVYCTVRSIDETNSLDEENELYGKICFNCKAPLADWSQCTFCRDIWWDDSGSHDCDHIRTKQRRDPEWFSYNEWTIQRFHTNPIPD